MWSDPIDYPTWIQQIFFLASALRETLCKCSGDTRTPSCLGCIPLEHKQLRDKAEYGLSASSEEDKITCYGAK